MSVRCYYPVKGYRDIGGGLSFAAHKSTGIPMSVPCGRCLGCRLESARQWAVRSVHEAQMHDTNCFLTLTYNEENLPSDFSLDRSAFPSFIRKLRRRGIRARYLHCGEYGSDFGRPHYHACLFGYSFPDRELWTVRNGFEIYRSAELESIWDSGYSEIGQLTFESARYVARYVTKKLNISENSSYGAVEDYYEKYHHMSGVLRTPEFATMSLKPGIGESWFKKFWEDVYPQDKVVIDGKVQRPPRYYDRLLEKYHPEVWKTVKRSRRNSRNVEDGVPHRLRAQEMVTEARLKTFTDQREVRL